MLTVYNTLARKKENFVPLIENEVRMYVCGPTVYDFFHIGNARSFVNSDFIRRYLEYKGYKVNFVMNLTDIDDKIIKKANEEKITASEIAKKYSAAFLDDINLLGIKKATLYPKATEHIGEIIEMIDKLIKNGFAYNIDGNVFYDVKKFKGYGTLSGKNIEELESGSRVEINESKINPLDFSLWKKAKENEPFWESPWGKGRPGWHIECSAMSCKHLGESFDIHAGGSDLIFPHHENEIAQSEAATGKSFVKYWLHFGFLNINEEKMSKSLGNFFTARDILKIYNAETLRLFFSQTHYASQLNFSDELLNASKKGLEKIETLIERLEQKMDEDKFSNSENNFKFDNYYKSFESAMDDDFNTPQAVAVIFDFTRDANKYLSEDNITKEFLLNAKEFLKKTAQEVLGIINLDKKKNNESNLEAELIELMIRLRVEAKQNKNFFLADQIRDELKKLGVILQDTKERTTYKKT
ncbi:MAG: cysteine--tRNA ligase [Chlorobiaceae bacterium]|nr:cysteine--tRNA ligase [Chlorobiaceae bacterium]MBA4310465.1 cysteine--tRNA ligase [Chlorobiaceae bacterium]